MIAEMITRRRIKGFYEAFRAKDAERIVSYWPEGVVLELPPGLPISGEWRGRGEARRLFQAIFAHNARLEAELLHVAIERPWSPTGRSRVYCEWFARETGTDGHVVETLVVSVTETRHWRTVRTTDYFANLPGMAEHYASMVVPTRRQGAAVAAA